MNRKFIPIIHIVFTACFLGISISQAKVQIDESDPIFMNQVSNELGNLRSGLRGIVCQELMARLDQSDKNTVIRPLTSDEDTWHPNDRKGMRSHVVPQDVKILGAERDTPTNAILYLHASRIDPKLSTFKLGTFVHKLAEAADLNRGEFSGIFKRREKRWAFFRNAWRDSLVYPLMLRSDEILTAEYKYAKMLDLIKEENRILFPIINIDSQIPVPEVNKTDLSNEESVQIIFSNQQSGDAFFSTKKSTETFIHLVYVGESAVRVRFGFYSKGIFEIYTTQLPRLKGAINLINSNGGFDFSELMPEAELVMRKKDSNEKLKFFEAWNIAPAALDSLTEEENIDEDIGQ